MGRIIPYKPRNRAYKSKPLFDRFLEKFKVDLKTGCWIWTSSYSGKYGTIFLKMVRGTTKQKVVYAHRVSYMAFRGPIPDGKEIDHICRNTKCVNPDHLRLVSRRENLLLGETVAAISASRTHCPQGHPYNEENTKFSKYGRYCIICTKTRERNRYKKNLNNIRPT